MSFYLVYLLKCSHCVKPTMFVLSKKHAKVENSDDMNKKNEGLNLIYNFFYVPL